MNKNEIVKANLTNVPAEMVRASENLQKVLNSVNASKKQLAKASYELKVQAEVSKTSFKDFIDNHFAMFDISSSRIYALAQTAEIFDCDKYNALWERIPVSKLEKMSRIKKAKSNTNVGAFGYIPFLQSISIHAILIHNLGCENSAVMLAELKRQYEIAKEEDRLEDAVKIKKQILEVDSAEPIAVPEDEEEQKAFYLNDGISRVCALPDSKVGELVKLYNLYSDTVKPETEDENNDNGGNNDNGNGGNNDSDGNDSKEKTVPEMIADILSKVQTLQEKAKAENIDLPNTTIQAFIESMENFGK